jgi:hypothetical protein
MPHRERLAQKVSETWTVAESCEQLENLAAEFMAEAVDCRENTQRCKELDAVKRRAAFRLITPKSTQYGGLPSIPIGYEDIFLAALEQHQKEMSDLYPA